jgi:hypothetical protein
MPFITLNMAVVFCSVVYSNLERDRRAVLKSTQRMPVIHVVREQYPTSQSTFISLDTGEQQRDKPHSADNILESRVGK